MRSYFTGFFFLVLISCAGDLFSQAFSPYSRFGLGYIPLDAPSSTRAMGGFSAGYSSPYNINHANPASYADLGITTFEVGVAIDAGTVRTSDSSYYGVNGTVSNISVGIPLMRGKWGMSFGLLPYSFVNYNFATTQVDTSIVNTGNGSLYQVYLGTAVKIKGFSIGVNAGYLFGRMDYTKGVIFPDSVTAYNVSEISSMGVSGFIYNLGAQYKARIAKKTSQNTLKSDLFFTVGAEGSTKVALNSRISNIVERYVGGTATTPTETIIDTPLVYADQLGKINMPYHFSFGLTAGNENWWIIGADFKYAHLSKFSYDLNSIPLDNSWTATVGGGIVPDYDSRKFFARIQYKIGAYFTKSEINYQGIQLSEYGATFGASIPIIFSGQWKEAAHLHFSADLGSRTPGQKDLITENYYRFNLGFTFNNLWFVKRRFD